MYERFKKDYIKEESEKIKKRIAEDNLNKIAIEFQKKSNGIISKQDIKKFFIVSKKKFRG
jgi:hypothetical protein